MTDSRWRAANPDGWVIRHTTADVILRLILEAKSLSTKHVPSAVVFDLDGTLMNVNHRTLNILKKWTRRECPENFSEELFKKLAALSIDDVGYSVADTFRKLGFDPKDPSLVEAYAQLKREWKQNFFDGKSLIEHDIPIKNAPKFVHELHNLGITIVYLSGRSFASMQNGTIKQLQKHNFPLENHKLLLKKDESQGDNDFKACAFEAVMNTHNVLANFENEYVNLAAMAHISPNCHHVIVDGPHSDRQVPPLNTPVFRIEQF